MKVILEGDSASPTSLGKQLRDLAESIESPDDWAANHDHYTHGTPKRS